MRAFRLYKPAYGEHGRVSEHLLAEGCQLSSGLCVLETNGVVRIYASPEKMLHDMDDGYEVKLQWLELGAIPVPDTVQPPSMSMSVPGGVDPNSVLGQALEGLVPWLNSHQQGPSTDVVQKLPPMSNASENQEPPEVQQQLIPASVDMPRINRILQARGITNIPKKT